MASTKFQICDRVSIVALSLSVFLVLLAFIPGGFFPSSILKGYIVIVCSIVAFVSWLLGRLIEGSFNLPNTEMLSTTGILFVALFLSAVFSHGYYLSFFGEGFEVGTFAVLGSLLLSVFLVSMLFSSRKRIILFLKSFFVVYIILALFQIVHLIFPNATSLGVFINKVDTPAGIWSDFAFLSGAVLVGFALVLQFMKPPKNIRIVSIIGLVLSLFFVILCNILTVWILVGFSVIIILIHALIANRFSEERKFPFLAFFLCLTALFLVLANGLFGGLLATKLNATFVDVHPSIQASTQVALSSLRANPVFGVGPNHYQAEWLIHKPISVNNHTLWDTPFSSGSSFFMTVAILGGFLSVIACILFLLAFCYESLRKVFVPHENQTTSVPIFGLFLLTFYFLLAIVLFSPGISIVVCAFTFIGLFFGAMIEEKKIPIVHFNFLKDQRVSFFSILLIVALLMVSAGVAYAASERFGAFVFFERGLTSAQKGNLDDANIKLTKAIQLSDLPVFERTRVLFAEQSIQKILTTPANSSSSDVIKSSLQTAISTGNTAARQAVSLDSQNPTNYLALGDLLRMIVPLKVDGIIDTAKTAYNNAITLAPNYPKPYFNLAELYFDSGDNTNARLYVDKAISLKPNYTDAFFLTAQIEVATGDTASAIKKVQNATMFDPNNPDVYFELGVLEYNSGDYQNAINAFQTTLAIDNQYLNAWYYRALTDQKIGTSSSLSDAITILKKLHELLPSNQNIMNAINGVPTSSNTPVTPIADISSFPKKSVKTFTSNSYTKTEKAKKLPLPTDTSTKTTQ